MRPIVRDRVAWSVCPSVGLSVRLVSPAKMAEPIKMPFGLRIWVGPGDHLLDEGSDPPWEGAILRGKDMPADFVNPRGGKWARPPLALWWHYRPRRTSVFVVIRVVMWLFVKLLWPLGHFGISHFDDKSQLLQRYLNCLSASCQLTPSSGYNLHLIRNCCTGRNFATFKMEL